MTSACRSPADASVVSPPHEPLPRGVGGRVLRRCHEITDGSTGESGKHDLCIRRHGCDILKFLDGAYESTAQHRLIEEGHQGACTVAQKAVRVLTEVSFDELAGAKCHEDQRQRKADERSHD